MSAFDPLQTFDHLRIFSPMHDRRTLTFYGLKLFAIFFGVTEAAAYLNRNPAASASDFAKGAAVVAGICAVLAVISVCALKHTRDDPSG